MTVRGKWQHCQLSDFEWHWNKLTVRFRTENWMIPKTRRRLRIWKDPEPDAEGLWPHDNKCQVQLSSSTNSTKRHTWMWWGSGQSQKMCVVQIKWKPQNISIRGKQNTQNHPVMMIRNIFEYHSGSRSCKIWRSQRTRSQKFINPALSLRVNIC